jgi:tetratricopeptide (TPR) repeat protein
VGLALALAGLLASMWGITRGVLRARSREGAFLLAGAAGALAASLIHALFDFNFHIFPNPHALVWIGGIAWGVWVVEEQGDEPGHGRRRSFRLAASVLGAGLCVACAWLALSGGISYVWNLKGEIARTRMDLGEANSDYEKAIRWDDGNWQPYLGLGNLKSAQAIWYRDPDSTAEREGRLRLAGQAAEYFQQAMRRNPGDMAAAFGLARAYNAMGDPEAALGQFRRAASYQRRHVFYREQLGIQLRQMGRDAEALEVFRQNLIDGVATDVSMLNIRALERKQAKESTGAPSPER